MREMFKRKAHRGNRQNERESDKEIWKQKYKDQS